MDKLGYVVAYREKLILLIINLLNLLLDNNNFMTLLKFDVF